MNTMDYTTGEWIDQPEDEEIETAEFVCTMQDDDWVCGFVGVLECRDTHFVQGWLKTAQCPLCDNEIIAN